MLHETPSRTPGPSRLLPSVTVTLAAAIFVVDTITPLDIAVAVLYVAVVLMAAKFCARRGVLAFSGICMALAVASFVIQHGDDFGDDYGGALARCLVSLSAIAITAALALQNQSAMAALRAQARLLDLTHDSIFVRDMRDVIVYWNRGAEELYGWSKEEAIGKRTHELLHTAFPGSLETIMSDLFRDSRWEGELTHVTKDGTEVLTASRWALQRDQKGRPIATLETNNDVTKRKQSEERIRQAERELRLAIDAIPGMVWSASSDDGSLEFINARWSEMGWTPQDVSGAKWPMLVHPDDAPKMERDWLASLTTGQPYENTSRVRRADGDYRWLLMRGAPLRDDRGTVLRWYGINADIEDRRRAEDALHRARSELAHVTRITTLGELIASIAHEVNQPLAAIVTDGEACLRWLGRETPVLGEARGSVERMIGNGRRASDVISRLRALSRKSDPVRARLTLNDVIDDALLLVERELFNRRVFLRREIDPTLPQVLGDRIQLQQVLINLLMNALQAMEPVTTRPRELLIRSEQAIDAQNVTRVLVTVQDSGVGIDPDYADRLFNAFFTTKANGVGMGLSICRSIIEAHDGRLWASPNEGSGARFQFSLPIAPDTRLFSSREPAAMSLHPGQ